MKSSPGFCLGGITIYSLLGPKIEQNKTTPPHGTRLPFLPVPSLEDRKPDYAYPLSLSGGGNLSHILSPPSVRRR